MEKNKAQIYSKIDYNNAINSQRNSLQMQASLLESNKSMKEYKKLRKKEFILKTKLKNNLKETKRLFTDLVKKLPETENTKKKKMSIQKTESDKDQEDIEKQLKDIQEKLNSLS
jgi:hypothetical protein